MSKSAKLLTDPYNFAVVQLPDRQYPGVVVQGDSLHILIEELQRSLEEEDGKERVEEAIERLTGVRNNYEAVCKEHGIDLPYFRS